MATAAMSGVIVNLLVGVTTGTSAAIAIPPSFKYHTFYMIPVGAVSAGAVTFESSDNILDANTWAPVATPVTATANDIVTQVVGVFLFLRARISTTIVGGTLNVDYLGGKFS